MVRNWIHCHPCGVPETSSGAGPPKRGLVRTPTESDRSVIQMPYCGSPLPQFDETSQTEAQIHLLWECLLLWSSRLQLPHRQIIPRNPDRPNLLWMQWAGAGIYAPTKPVLLCRSHIVSEGHSDPAAGNKRVTEGFTEIKNLLPPLQHRLSVNIGELPREIICTLRAFTQMCVLNEDDKEPHQQNQNILYNYSEL